MSTKIKNLTIIRVCEHLRAHGIELCYGAANVKTGEMDFGMRSYDAEDIPKLLKLIETDGFWRDEEKWS